MATITRRRVTLDIREKPDSSWRTLYLAGGAAALVASFCYITALIVTFTVPEAPTSGGAATLQYIADHRSVYILQQILWQFPCILLMVTFLSFWPVLKDLDKNVGAIGVVLGIISWGVGLAYPATGGGAPALVYLSDQYVMAATDAQRASFASAAEGFIAQNYVATLMGVLETAGILIVSFVMLKGIFPRWVAYLGMVTGAVGMVSESLKPLLEMGYIVYGLLVMIWIIAIGWEMIGLGRAAKPDLS